MDAHVFDRLTKAFARRLARRGLLGQFGAAATAALLSSRPARAQSDAEARSVTLACRPCNCDAAGNNCECCLNGITGGGIVRIETGDASLVLFATELGDEAELGAAGFVRWIDPTTNGGVTLESVGPIAYAWQLENQQAREIRGLMSVNAEGEEPFVLRLVVAGPDQDESDLARLEVGDLAALEGASERFGYLADGPVVGGDIQLLDTVAPVG